VRHLLIQSDDGSKGRSFRAELICYASANTLFDLASNIDRDTVRPVFCVLACADAEAAPVIANLRLGRKAKMWEHNSYGARESSETFDFLKSAKYAIVPQKHPEGVIVTVYQHDLLRSDVAMVDPKGVSFVLLPDATWLAPVSAEAVAHVQRWLDLQVRDSGERVPTPEQIEYITRVCFLWAKQIFARAKGPIPKDARFFSQALTAMLGAGLASFTTERSYGWHTKSFGEHEHVGFRTWGLSRLGMSDGIAVKASHEAIETLLAEQVSMYYRMVKE
jgi:hypothetical protein